MDSDLNERLRAAAQAAGITDRDGISWHEAPLPPVRHRCEAWTKGWSGLTLVERCACGGIRMDGRFGTWSEVNKRKGERPAAPRRTRTEWWGELRPYQRESGFAVAFSLAGLALLVLAIVGAQLVWPWLATEPGVVVLSIVTGLTGIGIAVCGLVLGHRVEERRTARIKEARRG